MRRLLLAAAVLITGERAYRLLARGALTLDLGLGRRTQSLGPRSWLIPAPRDLVFDVLASPYLTRTPRALANKLQVWERGSDMVLAAHFTTVKCGMTTTVETVRFERPERLSFRLVRGPVPHVREAFTLTARDDGTALTWHGELGTDLWRLGSWWGRRVARAWEKAVEASIAAVVTEAERRAPVGHGASDKLADRQ